ncbi:ATP-dependent RNA helicase [Marinobacterium nitratireducens]|uniref:ATP-dependent RNA helicase n=1 Tax=Marinobacterium nitratireducens TaxID=518897 RepID=A0A917ZNY0_9GAMM|nr:DEAD/DEAH box helicase [Marinobacterium nitratireducens]GGO86737.1 ATP-dependent RNA helicase [Marinobacterium nitratireducens]
MSSFDSLGLIEPLCQALAELGYRSPTAVQREAIPLILAGQDLVAEAQTGTGKTAAFALPLLQRLAGGSAAAPRALILVPTRELAQQVSQSLQAYGRYLVLRTQALFGGSRTEAQVRKLEHGADILVATPGRLLDLIGRDVVSLAQLQLLVLDEADRMLDLGFIADMKRICELRPQGCQTLLFSATLSGAIDSLTAELLKRPRWVRVDRRNSAAKTVQQVVYGVDQRDKADILSYLIQGGQWQQALVFTRTKKRADQVAAYLQDEGIDAAALHGDKPQAERQKVLNAFAGGRLRILVATDVAARGLHIESLPRVVNYDLPQVPEAYVHRIGRTGRAGGSGQAISLVAPDERRLLQAIESAIGRALPLKPVPFFGQDAGEDAALAQPARPKPRHRATKTAKPKPKPSPQAPADDTRSRAVRPSLLSGAKRRR